MGMFMKESGKIVKSQEREPTPMLMEGITKVNGTMMNRMVLEL